MKMALRLKKNPVVVTFYDYVIFSHKTLFLLSFTIHSTDFFSNYILDSHQFCHLILDG